MFAITEIVKEKLFALAEAEGEDVFHQCWNNWQDVSYLYFFFKSNPNALKYYGVDIRTAVKLVLKESENFFDDILDIAEGKLEGRFLDDYIFQPLHLSDDFDLPLIETKAYGVGSGRSFLRLYAVRLSDGAYIVVGGLIKTTKALQDCEEGILMLSKLKYVAKKLREHKMFDAFEIGVLIV